jgi:hypothetical protein
MASEMSVQFPELVETDVDGNKYINYVEMVPILVTAINELYTIMNSRETLERQVHGGANGDMLMSGAKGTKAGTSTMEITDETAKLYQNTPNPFSEETIIEYYVPVDAHSASLYVFTLSGELLQSLPIGSFGHGSVTISGSTLQAGMYVYSLVVDGQMVDTKRMILTK